MLHLNYLLQNAGWAILEISNGDKLVKLNVSYLHDSLKSLADSAYDLKNKTEKKVIFMDEPGEHWLILRKKENNEIEYQLRWYKEWASFNFINEDKFETILTGSTTLAKFTNQVIRNLKEIYEEFGLKEYKEKWKNNEFPFTEYQKLK